MKPGTAPPNRVRMRSLLRVYRLFGPHYRPHRPALLWTGLGLALTVITALLVPWPLKLIVDHVILAPPPAAHSGPWSVLAGLDRKELLLLLAGAYLLLRALDSLATYLHKVGLMSVSERLTRDIRERLFAQLQRLTLSFHRGANTGDLIYRLLADANDLKILLVEVPDVLAYRVLTLISQAALMAMLDWRLALIAFSGPRPATGAPGKARWRAWCGRTSP